MKRRSLKNKIGFAKIYHLLIIVAASVFLFNPVARAAPLNIILYPSPDIHAAYLDIAYDADGQDADTGILSVTGVSEYITIDDVGTQHYIYDSATGGPPPLDADPGAFSMTAIIDNDGTFVSGSLTVSGYVPDMNLADSGTLLTGNLIELGFLEGGGNPLEFYFLYTGGDVEYLYNNVGPLGGMIMSLGAFGNFPGNWTSDFNNNYGTTGLGQGQADIGVAPIPGAVWLFASGLLGLLGYKRKFYKK